jgi:putative aldouronate transport system permease protein
MSIVVTALGTFINIALTVLFAYPISRKDLPFRKGISFFLFFTMLFNGGLVPTYMMYTQMFNIKNTIWALIVPSLMMNAFYVFLMRSYFSANIPDALIEVGKLSKPMLATLMLMVGLNYWNDWMNGMYYVSDQSLYTIQMILNNMINNINFLAKNASLFGTTKIDMPTIGIRMGIAVIAIIPVMVVYPFLQKYFVKGIVVGGVKG